MKVVQPAKPLAKLSTKKPTMSKPKDYPLTPPASNQLVSAYTPVLKLPAPDASFQSHSTYSVLNSKGDLTIKKYTPTPTEYIQLESLLANYLQIVPANHAINSSPRLLLWKDFYPMENGTMCVTRARGPGCLKEQMEIIGKKRQIAREDIWRIASDVSEAVKELNEIQLLHLGIKPENIIFCGDKLYKLADTVFNEYVIGCIRQEEFRKMKGRLAVFPHMDGKTEHTVAIFGKESNEYINTKNFSKTSKLADRDRKEPKVWDPFMAPELVSGQTPVSPFGFSEASAKADSFSIGMLLVRMLCAVSDTSFKQFEELNRQETDQDFNKLLYEVVKFGEREGFERELSVAMPLLMKDPIHRPTPEKLFAQIQVEFL